MKNIAILGAGLSGLTVANTLKDYANVNLFEKSRGVSGRMSTRYADSYHFDHGTQFFKAKSNDFKAFIKPMIKEGVIDIWHGRFVEFEEGNIVKRRAWDAGFPHYVGVPGMNAIAQYLSRDLKIHLNTKVASIRKDHAHWLLFDDQDKTLGTYDWVISTIPSQQAADLLPESLPIVSLIKLIKMQACYSIMLGFEQPLNLEFDAALIKDSNISWISVNNTKPKRNQPFCLLINSTNQWATDHANDDPNKVMQTLCDETSQLIGHDLIKANHQAIHRWLYANIEKQQIPDTYLMDINQRIAACGDWCISGRVESAFTSGFTLANQLLSMIKTEST